MQTSGLWGLEHRSVPSKEVVVEEEGEAQASEWFSAAGSGDRPAQASLHVLGKKVTRAFLSLRLATCGVRGV